MTTTVSRIRRAHTSPLRPSPPSLPSSAPPFDLDGVRAMADGGLLPFRPLPPRSCCCPTPPATVPPAFDMSPFRPPLHCFSHPRHRPTPPALPRFARLLRRSPHRPTSRHPPARDRFAATDDTAPSTPFTTGRRPCLLPCRSRRRLVARHRLLSRLTPMASSQQRRPAYLKKRREE
uniref:Uncharacterized protein n=1 Tax=Oryza sativa subsp. japonica TaxID=39947 RepID=Q6ZC84_ORYSJ|nr:hypothetical protein [Oryza sativa Japonica Group]